MRDQTRRAAAIAGLVLLAGCTTTTYYDLPSGKTNEDFQKTLAKCRAQSVVAGSDPSMNGFMQAAMMQLYITNCLRAEGYIARQS